MAAAVTGRTSWPSRPADGHYREDDRALPDRVLPESGRAGVIPAPPAARRPPGRAEPAAGHRLRRDGPGRDPQRRHPPGPALPVGLRLQPARVGLRGAPRQAQGQRRQDQHSSMCSTLLVSPPGCHPPVGLDAGPGPTAPPPRGTRTKPRSCTATVPPSVQGNRPGPPSRRARLRGVPKAATPQVPLTSVPRMANQRTIRVTCSCSGPQPARLIAESARSG